MNRDDRRYAVLIDADNVSDKYVKIILDELSNYGVATYKRIYGDWTKPKFARWKTMLLEHSITPIQQYSYTVGKNATDSAMIIDAMDILYSGKVEGFCLVTSDSDFTRLASRLREAGMDVIGMGETKTPKPFISSCNRFKYLDLIALDNELADAADEKEEQEETTSRDGRNKTDKKGTTGSTAAAGSPKTSGKTMSAKSMRKAIMAMVEENSDEDEWFPLGDLGNLILKRYPDFDVRNFGFKKFTPFIKSLGAFDFKEERVPGSNNKLTYIREKQEKPAAAPERAAAPEKTAQTEKISEKVHVATLVMSTGDDRTSETSADLAAGKSGLPVAAPERALVEKKPPVPGRRNWRRKNFGGKHED